MAITAYWNDILTFAWIVIKILAILIPLGLSIAYLTLVERRVIGYIQNRIGPNRVGFHGMLQPFADGIKLLFKEVLIPNRSNRYLFLIAPVLSIAPALVAWSVIPFQKGLVLADIDVGLLFLFAMTSLAVYGVVIAGWSSNSRYAFLGSLRSAAQIISYEIPMGFAVLGVLMAAQSSNLTQIVSAQSGSVFHWFWLPLFPLFIVYWISGVAETNRLPFDVAEGESEIVAGFHVEYSGITFSIFFLAEYGNMILISTLAALMFLGGWHSPFEGMPVLGAYLSIVPGIFWLLVKIAFFLFSFLWFRATFPRYRYDQIMRLGWKIFIPVTLIWIVVVGIMVKMGVQPWF